MVKVTSISPNELSQRWNVKIKTLSAWRTTGKGPKFFYANENNKSCVRYPLTEIEAQEQRLHENSL